MSLARRPELPGPREQAFPAGELDPRAAVWLAARALVLVDCLPARVLDEVDTAFPEEVLEVLVLVGEDAGARVLEQELDGLRGVLLVRPDHAARAAFDP